MESRAGLGRVPSVEGQHGRKPTGLRRLGRSWLRTAVFLTCLAATAVAGWAFATSYVYDANGRLVVVTNDAGESARYFYDELGNLTHVQRLGAHELAIFGFTPSRGAPGVEVTVQGHGFSPTPANNTVTFNGVPATVSTATANELVTTVPTGATTGQIAVTVGANTALSATPFVVDEDLRPPVIQTVSPTIGAIGTPITVTGESLAPVPNQTDVRLNHRPAHPTATTNVEVVFPIPAQTGSGKVRVTTPYGTATSVQDVVVVGIADERWGSKVAAVVQVQQGHAFDLQEFEKICRANLSGYKVPRVVYLATEVKRSPAGKADYRWAKAFAAENKPLSATVVA